MFLDIQLLEENGYEIHVEEDRAGKVVGVAINGKERGEFIEPLIEAVRKAFPNVDRDFVSGSVFRAVSEVQGMDIVKICANR